MRRKLNEIQWDPGSVVSVSAYAYVNSRQKQSFLTYFSFDNMVTVSCQLLNWNITYLHFQLSNENYCIKISTKRHENMMPTIESIQCININVTRNKFLSAACKQNLDGDKNNPRICGASLTNFQLTLAWAKENFPVLRDLLGPLEPEICFSGGKSPYAILNDRRLRVIPQQPEITVDSKRNEWKQNLSQSLI